MNKSNILRYAAINALGTALYVAAVASFIYFLGEWFGGDDENVLIPIFMLMLFVFSAAFTGFLVFGRPVMWYLDSKKREAFLLLAYTLVILLIAIIIVFLFLVALLSM